jgi:hypothetical protein
MTATQEFVVPRSIPMTLAMVNFSSLFAANRPDPSGIRSPEAPKKKDPQETVPKSYD